MRLLRVAGDVAFDDLVELDEHVYLIVERYQPMNGCCFVVWMPWPAHKIEKLNDGGQSSFLIEEKVLLVHLHNYFVGVNRGDCSFFVLW